jgi:peptidoglycan/LPS O-acetylase OafA/YrhL
MLDNGGYSSRMWGVVGILISVAAAAISYRYVEAPIRAWARRRADRFRREPILVAPEPSATPAMAGDGPTQPT